MITSVHMKRLLFFSIIAFILYFLVVSPIESANVIKNVWNAIGTFFEALAVGLTTFFRALF